MSEAAASARGPGRRWLPWVGTLLGLAALAWVLRRFELNRFLAHVAEADARFLVLIAFAIMAEQLVRAWKWRQLLSPLRKGIGVFRLFGAIMAGYLLAIVVPFGFGTVARSWLVARREDLMFAAVLATVALDRLTDGLVFAALVPLALALVAFPDPSGGIRAGLLWGGAGSFALLVAAAAALIVYRRDVLAPDGRLLRLASRLPPRWADTIRGQATFFADGVVWPGEVWRGAGIILASVLIKLLAVTHFLWAGLAFGVTLQPAEYLFVIVFLGFLIIIGHFLRMLGGFVVGSIFVLGLFGVAPEPALAMVLAVQGASLLSVGAIGALALWRQGSAFGQDEPHRPCAPALR
ncbi:MAG: flippase-like domain-containing protein [Hyphomonadaceae bacterium]|nr:flippase-like domain-containing protein [Hyphomonadaceae bacterium]